MGGFSYQNPDPSAGFHADPSQYEMSPELMQSMVKAGVAPEKIALLRSQIRQAQALQNQQMPGGRGYGGVYTASNPLETLGTLGQELMAKRKLGNMGTPAVPGQNGQPDTPAVPGTGLYGQQGQAVGDMQDARMKYMMELLQKRQAMPGAAP